MVLSQPSITENGPRLGDANGERPVRKSPRGAGTHPHLPRGREEDAHGLGWVGLAIFPKPSLPMSQKAALANGTQALESHETVEILF